MQENKKAQKGTVLPTPWVDEPLSIKETMDAANLTFPLLRLAGAEQKTTIFWRRARNVVNGVCVLLQLGKDGTGTYQPLGVFFLGNGVTVTGTSLRDLPLRSIVSAYTDGLRGADILDNRHDILGTELVPDEYRGIDVWGVDEDMLKPLPAKFSRRLWFYALVGLQYDAVTNRYPNENETERMVLINAAPKSTVQRWITKARRMNLLSPAKWVK